ncbi:hypothetical protein [Candidatus Amarolinea dominans]|uniref:hypothetical protein n=1 Tax=Candidatus Amarolinea dominans TaxID=3140696 RepID=UPI001E07DD6C|nr:hypothetical protein [Anaerolineae bacterium]
MGCSLTSLIRLFPPLTPSPTPIAFLTPVLQPTFTPTVLPLTDTPFPPTPTITPTATDTPTPGPTPTATSTGEPTATATPGPMILVPVAELNVRTGLAPTTPWPEPFARAKLTTSSVVRLTTPGGASAACPMPASPGSQPAWCRSGVMPPMSK